MARIDLVPQKTVAATRPTTDGAVIPDAATGRRDALGIQRHGDVARAVAGRVFGEDAADDDRLGRMDLTQAALGLAISPKADHLSIAVGDFTHRATRPDPPFQAAPGLVGEVLQVEG